MATDPAAATGLVSRRKAIFDWANGDAVMLSARCAKAEERVEAAEREVVRQQELWSMQSRVIAALAAEVPDAVRARVLAPLREAERDA